MDFRDRICNLCLVKCANYKFIEGLKKTALNILLPTIEFNVIHESVICQNCEETLWKCFAFKEKCLHSYDYIVPLVNNKDAVRLDLKDIYLRKIATDTGVSEDEDVCGFCMGLVKNCYAVSLDVDEGRATFYEMIGQCLPELDLSIIKDPIICAVCHRSLENCFRFVTNCLTVEENLKKYEGLDINIKDQINMNSLLHSTMKTVEARDVGVNSVDVIKAEKQFCVKMENPEERKTFSESGVIKLEQMSCDDSEYVGGTGNKNEICMVLDNQKVKNEQQFGLKSMSDCIEEDTSFVKIEETFCGGNETKPEDGNFVEPDDQKFILHEEIEIKTDEPDFNRFEKKTRTTVNIRNSMQNCLMPNFKEMLIKPHIKQTSKNKDVAKLMTYHCEHCLFQTKNRHCLFKHSRIHKESSEVTMFKCEACPFETRWKESLKEHMLKHMKPSEVTMFKCDSCDFQTKRKRTLKYHMVKHMDPAEVTIFYCDLCTYQAKYKVLLNRHQIMHKPPSEVTMFKCGSCPFQTRRKGSLRVHLWRHKDPSEVTMFCCDFCSHQTKYKERFKEHLLTHKPYSERTMFNCDTCPFQTRRKGTLKLHMSKHTCLN